MSGFQSELELKSGAALVLAAKYCLASAVSDETLN
jgi:hypothetical protein